MHECERQTSYLEQWDGRHEYGEQFGLTSSEHLRPVVDLIAQHCHGNGIEIGSGGGRWTREIVRHCDSLISIDGTPASERRIHETQIPCDNIEFRVCTDGRFLCRPQVDFVFSFDVFVHFHPRLFLSYVDSIKQALRMGGVLLLHFATLLRGSEYNARCFKYWDVDDVIAETGCELVELMQFPEGFGSTLVVLRKRLES